MTQQNKFEDLHERFPSLKKDNIVEQVRYVNGCFTSLGMGDGTKNCIHKSNGLKLTNMGRAGGG